MVKRHDYIGTDFSDEDIIWKYFSLPAFLALLEDKKLYFSRVSSLSDPNEFPITVKDANAFGLSMDDYKATIDRYKRHTYVNCWRLSEYEAFGMWNAYADSATGIAIKTDVKYLFAAINCIQNINLGVIAGKVLYVDHLKEMIQKQGEELNIYHVFLAKTKPYQNENELRLIIDNTRKQYKGDIAGIPVDIDVLIKEVYVGSSARKYVPSLIKKLLTHYKVGAPVIQSVVK